MKYMAYTFDDPIFPVLDAAAIKNTAFVDLLIAHCRIDAFGIAKRASFEPY